MPGLRVREVYNPSYGGSSSISSNGKGQNLCKSLYLPGVHLKQLCSHCSPKGPRTQILGVIGPKALLFGSLDP